MNLKDRAINALRALDYTLNAILGGADGETLSSRAAKASLRGKHWGCVLCTILGRLDKNHCLKAIQLDRGDRIEKPATLPCGMRE